MRRHAMWRDTTRAVLSFDLSRTVPSGSIHFAYHVVSSSFDSSDWTGQVTPIAPDHCESVTIAAS